MAATGGILWVGTESGRLIRLDTVNGVTEEVRGRIGSGRLDNAIWRIFADPHSHAALVILRNADGYLASGSGSVRPRWLAKLRGLRCVSATWIRLSRSGNERSVVLLGTAFGALFSLMLDRKHEKDDTISSLWNVPSGERIDGIRVEQVADKFVAVVATASALYLFSDASSLSDLFVEERTTVVGRPGPAMASSSISTAASGENSPPAELHFMTGSSGVASRRFVWAETSGVTHGQLAVRRRRREPDGTHMPRTSSSTVITDVVDRETLSWDRLKETSGSEVPLTCNLSAFHVLVLYPTCIYAFNHISGHLTQKIPLCASDNQSNTPGHSDRMVSSTRMTRVTHISKDMSFDDPAEQKCFLPVPAAGLTRDVLTDSLWVYTSNGDIARLNVTNEEQTEAWKAAKAMGRFDLAMALAPLISSGLPEDTSIFQTREAVLEAQADHAASQGDWDVAAQLYAKTKRPIESVVLSIVDACWTPPKTAVTPSVPDGRAKLRDLGIGARLKTIKHVITYLVRKLDRIDSSKPMQLTILATLLVQLYSSQLACETDEAEREALRKDFGNFLADRYRNLDLHTALGVLSKNGCYEEAWNLAVLSGDVLAACDLSSRRGQVDQSLSLLKSSNVLSDNDMLSRLVISLSNMLTPQAPKRVASAVSGSLKKSGHYSDHMTVVQGLARVAREAKNVDKSREAYQAASTYLFDLLQNWKTTNDELGERKGNIDNDWFNLMMSLFVLHAEFGVEADAQRSYDHLIAPLVSNNMSQNVTDILGGILRCAIVADYRTLCVHVYQALGLHETAINIAVGIDLGLAEERVTKLGPDDVTDNVRRQLWRSVAHASDDAVRVVERSNGLLQIEDVLNDMKPFESASERVKSAVANSLEEHKRLANVAKSEAVSALEVTSNLREDVEEARSWQREQQAQRARHQRRYLSCGHDVQASERAGGNSEECGLCGDSAIDMLDAPFDTGLALPVRASEIHNPDNQVKTNLK